MLDLSSKHGTAEAARFKPTGIVRLSPEGHDQLLALRQHFGGLGLSATIEALIRDASKHLGVTTLI